MGLVSLRPYLSGANGSRTDPDSEYSQLVLFQVTTGEFGHCPDDYPLYLLAKTFHKSLDEVLSWPWAHCQRLLMFIGAENQSTKERRENEEARAKAGL